MTIRPLRHFLLACLALGGASLAHADIIVAPTFDPSNQAAPPDTTDYEGMFFDGTAAPYNITIGTFQFTIPTGDKIVGMTISGTFGDQNIPVTALTDLYINGDIKVASCDSATDPCAAGTLSGAPVSWSYTFTTANLMELAPEFASGVIDFTAIQNSLGSTIVGTPTLSINAVPEPGFIFPVAGGLLAMAVLRRRKVTIH